MTIPIWATEEKAIIDFISVIFRHCHPTNTIPKTEIDTNIETLLGFIIKDIRRITPIPPNFSRIPARIIEP